MKILKSIGIITVIAMLSKVLGFLRDALIASYFGASETTDAYFIALTVPNLLFAAFGTAIASGIIPMYVEAKNQSESKGKKLIHDLGSLFLMISLGITVVAFIFSPQIVDFIGGDMTAHQRDLTIYLTKITIPSFIFFVLSAFANGVLNAHKNFMIPAVSTLPNNVIIVIFTVALSQYYGIVGITYCALIAAITQYVIQYPAMKRHGIGFSYKLTKLDQQSKKALLSFLPIIIASIAVQMNMLTDQMVAARLDEGSVSALNYAVKLLYLPLSIVATSLITVFFPNIVEAAKTAKHQFLGTSLKGMNIILLISVPIAVVMFVMNKEIIHIVFQRGEFDEKAAKMTAYTLFFYIPALFSISVRDYLIRCFMAVDRNRITMISSIIVVPLNMALCIWLSHYLQSGGISLATSIAITLQSIYLLVVLIKDYREKAEEVKGFFVGFGKLVALFVLLYGCTYAAKMFIPVENVYGSFIVNGVICMILFVGLSFALKINELMMITHMVKKKKQ